MVSNQYITNVIRWMSPPGCGLRAGGWYGLLADQELLGEKVGGERLREDEERGQHVRYWEYFSNGGVLSQYM